MNPHLLCAEQQVSPSNLTKYCACHAERLTYLIIITYETSFTMRGATGVTIQPHQIPRLPHKMTRMLDRRHIWNIISNARSNRYHDPTSPNTAPATKNDTARFQRKSPKTGETSFPMRGRSEHDPSMIRAWSDHENANRNPPRNRGYFSTSPRAFSIVKYNVSRPILHSNLHQVLRLPRKVTLERHQVLRLPRKVTLELHQVLRLPLKVTLELHQILRLPRKVTLERHQVLHLPRKVTLDLHQILRLPRRKTHLLNHHHVWNLIYNKGSNRCHHPTSPNTAPATQNDSHAWSSSHMKHHFQCAEQQVSRSNLTKYCACHEKWHCKENPQKKVKRHFQCGADPSMIRAWSDHENANRNPPRNRGYFSTSPRAFSIVKYNVSRPILHSNLHQVLRLPLKVTLELDQILRLPRKVTLERHQVLHLPRKVTLDLHQILRLPRRKTHLLNHHHVWNLIYNAGSNRCHHPTSPNTAPATQNDSHAWSSSHMKHHFQCAEQQVSRSNLTKYWLHDACFHACMIHEPCMNMYMGSMHGMTKFSWHWLFVLAKAHAHNIQHLFCHAWACFMDHAWHAWGSCNIFLTSCHVYRLQRLSGKQNQHAYDFSFLHAWFMEHAGCMNHIQACMGFIHDMAKFTWHWLSFLEMDRRYNIR